MIFFLLANIKEYIESTRKPEWRKVVDYVDQNADVGNSLFFYYGHIRKPFIYYSKRSDLKLNRLQWEQDKSSKENLNEFNRQNEGIEQFWLITRDRKEFDEIIDQLSNSYEVIIDKNYWGLNLYKFRAKS